jgi:FixJ family two-component response regulator
MSGLDLQARLNAERCPIATIFITAHGDEEMRLQAMRAGAVEFLPKPFDVEFLVEIFAQLSSVELTGEDSKEGRRRLILRTFDTIERNDQALSPRGIVKMARCLKRSTEQLIW